MGPSRSDDAKVSGARRNAAIILDFPAESVYATRAVRGGLRVSFQCSMWAIAKSQRLREVASSRERGGSKLPRWSSPYSGADITLPISQNMDVGAKGSPYRRLDHLVGDRACFDDAAKHGDQCFRLLWM